ncbi:MAG: gamma-glutamyltransferase [Nevskiales bacterium]
MQHGVVAAGHGVSAQAAADILSNGGNAYDAIAAGFFAACVAEPVLTSLGGGGFAMVRPKGGDPYVYDSFCQTPIKPRPAAELDFLAIEADFGTAQQTFHIGAGSIATPGIVAGLFAMHKDLGLMPMPEVVQPAIAAAKKGVRVTDFQAYVLQVVHAIYSREPASRSLFASPGKPDRLIQAGEIFTNPELADVLDSLAQEGPALFYRGEIAQRMLAQTRGSGHLCAQDLEAYSVIRQRPLLRDFAGWQVALNPPPASGGLLIALGLSLLQGLAIPQDNNQHAKLIACILNSTQEARIRCQAQGELSSEVLLDPELVRKYQKQISTRLAALRGTTHLSVLDSQGNAAALTVSNGEGCGTLLPGCGFMLNNMLGEDDLNPQGFHQWAANQRLTSMMCPGMAAHASGDMLVFGSGGSNRIRSAILQVLVNFMGRKLPLDEAIEAPRLHVESQHLSIEGGHSDQLSADLQSMFQDLTRWDCRNLFFGGVHAVGQQNQRFIGHGDSRRDGVCLKVS